MDLAVGSDADDRFHLDEVVLQAELPGEGDHVLVRGAEYGRARVQGEAVLVSVCVGATADVVLRLQDLNLESRLLESIGGGKTRHPRPDHDHTVWCTCASDGASPFSSDDISRAAARSPL